MVWPVVAAAVTAGSNYLANKSNEKINKQNNALQREFAQHGIQWKVADAKAAGIHPLAALGAQTHSFQPSSIGMESVAPDLTKMGQSVSRAANATKNHTARMQSLMEDKLTAEISLINAQATNIGKASNPAMPTDNTPALQTFGSNDVIVSNPAVELEKNRVPMRAVGTNQSVAAGNLPDQSFVRGRNGAMMPVMPEALTQAYENNTLGSILWALRNQVAPNLGFIKPPSRKGLKPYEYWEWTPHNQGYSKYKRRNSLASELWYKYNLHNQRAKKSTKKYHDRVRNY
jgi:hypothetical protein